MVDAAFQRALQEFRKQWKPERETPSWLFTASTPQAAARGLYSHSLKQLLIWNLPDREAMMQTVRHEGFHQYLDSLTAADPPHWFNEGLAEYYGQADLYGGEWQEGQRNAGHVKILRSKELLAFEENF